MYLSSARFRLPVPCARLASLFLLFLPPLAAADALPGTFTVIEADGGGWVTGIAAHASGRLYARTDVGGVYRSDNGGLSWQWISGAAEYSVQMNVQGLAVHPVDPDIVFATAGTRNKAEALGRGVWRTSDGGGTWQRVLGPDEVPAINLSGNDFHRWGGPVILFDPADAGHETLWAGTRRTGLFRSTDGGDSWEPRGGTLFADAALIALHRDTSRPGHLWVGGGYHNIGANPPEGEGGLWFSADDGITFTKVLDARMVYRVERHPATDRVFAAMRDSLGTPRLLRISAVDWSDPQTFAVSDITANLGSGQDDITLLKMLGDGSILAGYQNQRTARSFDGGDTWESLAMGLDPAAEPPAWRKPGETQVAYGRNDLVEDPNEPGRWILTTGFGVETSVDGGATWTPASRGITEVVTFKPRFHPTDADRVYIPSGDLTGILIEDGGVSGRGRILRRDIPLWPNDAWNSIDIDWGSGGEPTWTVLGSYFNNNAQFSTSSDCGVSWTATPGGSALGGGSGLPNWSPVIAALTTGDEWLVALQQNVYRSTDGGASFSQVLTTGFSGDSFSGYDNLQRGPGDVRYFYRIFGGLHRSADAGASWNPVSLDGTFGTVVADPLQPSRLYAILYAFWPVEAEGSLLCSIDGGDTWTSLGDFTVLDTGNVSEYPRVDARGDEIVVWAKRPGDTRRHIYYSNDSGSTWGRISRPGNRFPDVNGLALDPHRPGVVWIATAGRTASVFRPATPLQQWRQTHFGTMENAGDAADGADPDGDGIPNLVEYALGGDPMEPFSAALPERGYAVVDGENYLTLSVQRDPEAAGVVWSIEVSPDLASWHEGPLHTLTLVDNPAELSVRDAVSLSEAGPRFIRLTLSRNE
ncbi:MAG: hypothetical protein JJU00_01420 [Opitutales bacterium]|nr:hypothetical protein [Opitutales bacterium]